MALANEQTLEPSLSEFQRRLLELRVCLSSLASDFKVAATSIEATGELPERSLAKRIDAAWFSFDQLGEELGSMCALSYLEGDWDRPPTLSGLEEALERALKKEAELTTWHSERALAVRLLTALSEVRCPASPDWEPLAEFRLQAADLKIRFDLFNPSSDAGTRDALLTAYGPFKAFYRLLADTDGLSLKDEAELDKHARLTIPAQVVTAALRCRLILPAVESPSSNETDRPAIQTQTRSIDGGRPSDAAAGESGSSVTYLDRAEPTDHDDAEIIERQPSNDQGVAPVDLLAVSAGKSLDSLLADAEAQTAHDIVTDESVAGGGIAPRQGDTAIAPWVAPDNSITAQEAAVAVRALAWPARFEALNDLVWRLLRENRLAPAWYISSAIEERGEIADAPAALIESLIYAPRLRSSIGSIADRLRDSLYAVQMPDLPEGEGGSLATSLLMLAATLRPAILASGSGALDILRRLKFQRGFEALNQLVDVLLAAGRSPAPLTLTLLQGGESNDTWEQARLSLRERAQNWLEHNRHCKVVYQPTTEVWHTWLREYGSVGSVIERVGNDKNDAEPVSEVLEQSRAWRDHQRVDKRLRETDSQLRKGNARRIPIEARAIRAIRQKCAEAADIVSDWLELLERCPATETTWDSELASHYRNRLTSVLEACQKMVEARDHGAPGGLCRSAAIAVIERSLADLTGMLQPRDDRVPSVRNLLFADLLRTRGIRLNSDWTAGPFGSDDVLDAVLQMLSEPPREWVDELHRCWEERNFFKSAAIIEILEDQGFPQGALRGADIASLRDEQRTRLEEGRIALSQLKQSVLNQLLSSRLRGLINEDERLRLTEWLMAVDEDATLRVGEDRGRIEDVREELNGLESRHLAEFRDELEQLQLSKRFPDAASRVADVLDSKDLVTVREYVTILEEKGSLPDVGRDGPGVDFFPGFIERMDAVLRGSEKQDLGRIEERIRNRARLGPLNFEDLLTPGQAKECAEVIRARRRLKTSAPSEVSALLQKIFEFIGFTVDTVKTSSAPAPSGHRAYQLNAQPLLSRDDCSLWEFGSRCQGQYRIVLLDGYPLEDDIIRDTRGDDKAAVIAIFFGVMSDRRRRDLAHALRRVRDRRLLVLDDALLLYLCTQKRRLLAFFNAAGNFCSLHPYTTTSGLVPPEMFFGRKEELKSVFEPTGTNLVYGGRQLGKTALLKEVCRQYHRPRQGVIVEFFDLEHGENLGRTRPMEDIWIVIASALEQHGVLQRNTRKPESIQQKIEEWLRHDHLRRIVLLLDEADRFLDSDAEHGWLLVGRLKTMMLATDQRFKVVFSGLHNVQRTSHDVNTPLAHLGRPLCVGPFLHRDELRDAIAMVRVPFEALGYRFANPDLIGRILAQTNYYPSLIQLFCRYLLDELSRSSTADPRTTPPYIVSLTQIEHTAINKGLQAEIRDRFRWTLELDNRYRVIALCIAMETLDNAEAAVSGFRLSEIREWAISHWKDGFVDSDSPDAFRALLEEMTELGVLRQLEGARYVMRSPNVMGLLGSQDGILIELDSACRQPRKIEYQAKTFRRAYHRDEKWRRSPLTAEQESTLLAPTSNGLLVLFGSPAAGLDAVLPFIQILEQNPGASSLNVVDLVDIGTCPEFERRLDASLRDRSADVTLVAIPATCDWDEHWVLRAAEIIQRRGGIKQRFVKVLFMAGSMKTWRWAEADRELVEKLNNVGLVQLSLSPWSEAAVRCLKTEAEFGQNTDEDNELFYKTTGYWGSFLCEVGEQCVEHPGQWRDILRRYSETSLQSDYALRRFDVVPEALRVLTTMARWGDAWGLDELQELVEQDHGPGHRALVDQTQRWADLLRIIRPASDAQWTLDPFLQKLLRAIA